MGEGGQTIRLADNQCAKIVRHAVLLGVVVAQSLWSVSRQAPLARRPSAMHEQLEDADPQYVALAAMVGRGQAPVAEAGAQPKWERRKPNLIAFARSKLETIRATERAEAAISKLTDLQSRLCA